MAGWAEDVDFKVAKIDVTENPGERDLSLKLDIGDYMIKEMYLLGLYCRDSECLN